MPGPSSATQTSSRPARRHEHTFASKFQSIRDEIFKDAPQQSLVGLTRKERIAEFDFHLAMLSDFLKLKFELLKNALQANHVTLCLLAGNSRLKSCQLEKIVQVDGPEEFREAA